MWDSLDSQALKAIQEDDADTLLHIEIGMRYEQGYSVYPISSEVGSKVLAYLEVRRNNKQPKGG